MSYSMEYSTTEQQIGKWINGKPLYQITKVINPATELTVVGINNMNNYVHHIDNIDTPLFYSAVSFKADATNGDYCKVILQESTSRNYVSDTVFLVNSFDRTYVKFRRAANAINETDTIYITLQYTKTTDSAA